MKLTEEIVSWLFWLIFLKGISTLIDPVWTNIIIFPFLHSPYISLYLYTLPFLLHRWSSHNVNSNKILRAVRSSYLQASEPNFSKIKQEYRTNFEKNTGKYRTKSGKKQTLDDFHQLFATLYLLILH